MKTVELQYVCEIIAGQSPPSSTYNQEANGLPFFQGKADFGELFPKVRIWCNTPNKIAMPGDILISVRAPVGPTNINNVKSCIGRGLSAIRTQGDIDQKFLLHYFRSIEKKLADKASGSTFSAITQKDLKSIEIPLPSLKTQKKIAEILDAADTLRQKTKTLIEKYDQLTQSLFLDLFGDPMKIGNKWDQKKMIEVCNKVTDGTHDTPKRLKEGIKFITGKHIRPFSIDYTNSDFVTEKVHNEIYRRCNPEEGDVLYTNIGANVGTAALNTVDYEFSMKNVALLKPNNNHILGRYLEYHLNYHKVKAEIIRIASLGGAQKFLSLKDIRELIISCPPLLLQNQFAERVQAIEEQKAKAQASLVKSEELFQSLLQKAFKGEIN